MSTQLDREIATILIPGITKWDMFGGGTFAAEGKHSYSFIVPEGKYYVSPFTTGRGRHAGYYLKFAAQFKRPKDGHGGLWHDLGVYRSPQAAASAAKTHYAASY